MSISRDVQGLFARGYGDLRAAAFLLLGIEDAAAARRWLGDLAGAITSSEARPDDRALNLAFTSSGLAQLGLPEAALQMFSNEFVAGMTTAHRSRILGDLEENAPAEWEWGGPSGPRYRHRAAPLRAGRCRPTAARSGADRSARRRRARATPPAGNVGSGRVRALRLSRRDLAAVRRGPLEGRPAGDDRPRRGVPPRLPERVRPVHGPAAARSGG